MAFRNRSRFRNPQASRLIAWIFALTDSPSAFVVPDTTAFTTPWRWFLIIHAFFLIGSSRLRNAHCSHAFHAFDVRPPLVRRDGPDRSAFLRGHRVEVRLERPLLAVIRYVDHAPFDVVRHDRHVLVPLLERGLVHAHPRRSLVRPPRQTTR